MYKNKGYSQYRHISMTFFHVYTTQNIQIVIYNIFLSPWHICCNMAYESRKPWCLRKKH